MRIARLTVSRSNVVGQIAALRPFLSAFIAGLIGVALSVGLWFVVAAREDQLASRDFTIAAYERGQSLQSGLNRYLDKIRALRALFGASSHGVTREEFEEFTRDFIEGRTAILSFSWAPRVRHEDRTAHEMAGRAAGIPNYQISTVTPKGLVRAADQPEYFPIFFSNAPAPGGYGINLQDGGIRQRPLDRARDGNSLATSENFRLQTGAGNRTGFLVLLPIYRSDLPHETVEERRVALAGIVQGVFQFDVVIDTILADAKLPISILMYDGIGHDDLPVYARSINAERAAAARLMPRARAMEAVPNWKGYLEAGDRTWQLVILPAAGLSHYDRHDRAWIVVFASLMFTGLAVSYMGTSIRNVLRLQAASHRASELARTDSLTGLANRRAFVERLGLTFAGAKRGGGHFAVHFIDLDAFKDTNDTEGHPTGDKLLQEVALRLTAAVRANDMVARFGGDEFAVVQTDIGDASDAATLAGKINAALASPYMIEGIDLRVTASIGISLYEGQPDGVKSMMMQADLALYGAKRDGGNGFRFHSVALNQDVHLRVTLAAELRTAIQRGELECLYQPQVDIRSGRILGLEALVRWNHPQRGLIMPSIFIPIAERAGLIQQLGSWVFDAACAQLAQWVDEGIAPRILAVNISGLQLQRSEDFVGDIAGTLARHDINPAAIELELTETVLMEASQKNGDILKRLRTMGLGVAIDDFGTGYSSLRYLTEYPINRLKIAQELVFRVTDDPRHATVVKAAVRLANDLGIEAIAEGVETEAQAQFLLAAGCSLAQGYLYSRPANAAAATALLRRGRIDVASVAEATAEAVKR